jgi:hypothetical protein
VNHTPDSPFFAFGVATLIAGASTERAPQRRHGNFCARWWRSLSAPRRGEYRHCERREAIQAEMPIWIASSLALLAMTEKGGMKIIHLYRCPIAGNSNYPVWLRLSACSYK